MSTGTQAADSRAGKGEFAEGVRCCLRRVAWAVGKHPPDCHMYL
jgi:hypothetical protein